MKKKILIIGKGSSGQRFFKTLKNKYDVQSIAAKKFNKLLLKNLKFPRLLAKHF